MILRLEKSGPNYAHTEIEGNKKSPLPNRH